MAKGIKLPSRGPDDPLFSGKTIISVPISRPRAKEDKPCDLMQALENALEEPVKREMREGDSGPK